MPRNVFHSEAYKIQIRALWYQHGCLPARKAIELNVFPPDEQGNVVSESALGHWIGDDSSWHEWRDVMDAELSVKVENELLRDRMEIIKEQLKQSREIRNEAAEHIINKGFDSSAAAVSAFFKSTAEERGLMQIQKVIEDLSKLETTALQKKFKELAERSEATDDKFSRFREMDAEVAEEVAEPLD